MALCRRNMLLLVIAWLLCLSPVARAERRTVRGGTIMNLGIGFLVGGATTAPGVGVSFSTHISNAPVFIGVDSGGYFYPSPFAWLIPVLPMVKYYFRGAGIFTPTVGLSLGPVLALGSYANTLSFGMFFKPGMQISFNRELDFVLEPRIGVIGSSLIFNPEVNLQFNI